MKKTEQTRIFPKTKPSLKLIKKEIDSLAVDPITKLGLRVGFLSLGLSLLVLAVSWVRLPPEVPLFYSQPYGESQLVSVWGLWWLPGLSFGVEMVSIRGAGVLIEKDKLLAQILTWVGALVAMMGLVSLLKIILLVT